MSVEATDPLTGVRVEVGEVQDGERLVRCLSCRALLFVWPAVGVVDDLVSRTKEACATHWIRSKSCGVVELEF